MAKCIVEGGGIGIAVAAYYDVLGVVMFCHGVVARYRA